MNLKEVGRSKLIQGQEYLFKDSRGCFRLGTYCNGGINGFYTDSYNFIDISRVCVIWELPNENS